MKIAGVVVTYNRKKLLVENIEALLKQTLKDVLTIIIIDNNSTDGTRDALQIYRENEKIVYVNTGKNLGGAGGFHYGIRYAAEHDFDYIWVMDDDCIPTLTSLEALLKASEKLGGQYGFLASKVLWKNRELCKMNIQRTSLWNTVHDWKTPLVPIIFSSFVSLFVPTQIVREYGLPIKEFFIWTDDWEFTRRISRKLPCYLVNDSVVIHKSKKNFGANIVNDELERLDRYDYLYRNDVYLYRREGWAGLLYEVLRLIVHTIKVLAHARGKKYSRLKKIYSATYKGLYFHPCIEFPERKKI